MADYKLIMLSNSKPGRQAELVEWYEGHLDDMLRIPGVVGAQCFDYDAAINDPHAYKNLAVYDISTDDLSETLAAIQRTAGTAEMPMTDAMDAGQGSQPRTPPPPSDPSGPGQPAPDGPGPDDNPPPAGPGRYQHIPVTVED